MPLNILFTGNYDISYNRTVVIKAGLLKLGHKVTEFPFKKRNSDTRKRLSALSAEADFVFLPSFTHKDVPFVKKNILGKPLIFDPLISRYMTKVMDYRKVFKYGLAAFINRWYDKHSMETADFVITDTNAHLQYYNSEFSVPASKMGTVYIGNDFSQFFPDRGAHNKSIYTVGFYGGFIPLQGVINILGAAALLKDRKDLVFRLVGSGFEYKKARSFAEKEELKNVIFTGWITMPGLRTEIQSFDIALGIFGETPKTKLVIPNKVYHYAACRKPIITRDTPAIREIFTHEKDILLVEGGPRSIADGILRLKNDSFLAASIASRAYEKIISDYSETKVAERIVDIFKNLKKGIK